MTNIEGKQSSTQPETGAGYYQVKFLATTGSLISTELAVLNIDTAVMDTPRIVNSAIRVQLVSQIK